MTDEELLAEEYICNGKCQDDITRNYVHCKTCTRLRDFLVGLKAGKDINVATRWHKVADGDLPEAENNFWSRTVLLQTNKGSSIIGFYDHANKAWYEKSTDDIVYGAVAWCEIPKYTKEIK